MTYILDAMLDIAKEHFGNSIKIVSFDKGNSTKTSWNITVIFNNGVNITASSFATSRNDDKFQQEENDNLEVEASGKDNLDDFKEEVYDWFRSGNYHGEELKTYKQLKEQYFISNFDTWLKLNESSISKIAKKIYTDLKDKLGLQPQNRSGKQPFYIQKPNADYPDMILGIMKDADYRGEKPRGSVVRGTWGDTAIWKIDTSDNKIVFDLMVPVYRGIDLSTDPVFRIKDIEKLVDSYK